MTERSSADSLPGGMKYSFRPWGAARHRYKPGRIDIQVWEPRSRANTTPQSRGYMCTGRVTPGLSPIPIIPLGSPRHTRVIPG